MAYPVAFQGRTSFSGLLGRLTAKKAILMNLTFKINMACFHRLLPNRVYKDIFYSDIKKLSFVINKPI